MHDLLAWARANGAFIHPSLSIREISGVRGLCVTHDAPAGTPLVVLPAHLQLGADLADLDLLAFTTHWSVRLGLALCAERERGTNFEPYVAQLPHAPSLVMMPNVDLAPLRAWPPTLQRAQAMRDGMQRIHRQIANAAAAPPLERLSWGAAMAASRAYRVRGAPGASGDAARLLPVIDLANHAGGRATATVGNAPSPLPESDVMLAAVRDLAAGEEVLTDYGGGQPLTNERLLLEYGFALEDNADDAVTLPVASLAVGLQAVADGADRTPEEAEALGAMQTELLRAGGVDLAEASLEFGTDGAPTPASALLTHVLVARSAAELGESAVEGGRLVKAPPALAARAAAALRAVALAALSEMGAPAAPRGEGIEAAAAQFVAAQRAILERVANPS